MIFNVWTFLFEVVNFLVLVYVLHRLLYRPLREAIDRRREANAKAQADARKARQEADRATRATHRADGCPRGGAQEVDPQGPRPGRGRAQSDDGRGRERRTETARGRRHDSSKRERRPGRSGRSMPSSFNRRVALAERILREASSSSLAAPACRSAGRRAGAASRKSKRRQLRGELEADDPAVVETAADLNGDDPGEARRKRSNRSRAGR